MRRFVSVLFMLMLVVGCPTALSQTRILTSFYPMYVFARELADGAEGVEVKNMAEQSTGCLHDYQLGQRDAAEITEADIMVVNGGGMEQFMDRIQAMRTDMTVITASAGIEMTESCEAGMLNAHVWLSPKLAIREIRTIAEGLSAADPQHAQTYRVNAERMVLDLEALNMELSQALSPVADSRIITFHEAFNYFAADYKIVVADVIAHEPGEAPSTREIAKTCDLVNAEKVEALFTEPQYPTQAADIISRETGVQVYQMDPCVSGDGTWNGYMSALRSNAGILLEELAR